MANNVLSNSFIQQKNPALAAMKQTGAPPAAPAASAFANSDYALSGVAPTYGAPGTPTAPAALAQPTAETPPPVDASMYTPQQIDSTQSNATYDKASAAAQTQLDTAKQQADRYTSGLMAANGANAARMGLAAGGASYLSGQRAASQQGFNNYQSATGQAAQAQEGIYSQQAGTQAGTATQNAGFANAGLAHNADTAALLQNKTADAQATQQANTITSNISSVKNSLKGMGIDVDASHGATWGTANSLITNLQQATPGTPQAAAAQKALTEYTTKLNALKAQNPKAYKEGNTSNAWYAVLKKAEASGYFAGTGPAPAPGSQGIPLTQNPSSILYQG